MKSLLQSFYKIDSKFVRFIFVGILNTGFGCGVYCLLIFLGLSYWWAALLSQIIGVIFNFKTIGVLVFENGDNSLFLKFIACYVLGYFINITLIHLFVDYTPLNEYWSGICATPFVAVFSFIFQKTIVYKK